MRTVSDAQDLPFLGLELFLCQHALVLQGRQLLNLRQLFVEAALRRRRGRGQEPRPVAAPGLPAARLARPAASANRPPVAPALRPAAAPRPFVALRYPSHRSPPWPCPRPLRSSPSFPRVPGLCDPLLLCVSSVHSPTSQGPQGPRQRRARGCGRYPPAVRPRSQWRRASASPTHSRTPARRPSCLAPTRRPSAGRPRH